MNPKTGDHKKKKSVCIRIFSGPNMGKNGPEKTRKSFLRKLTPWLGLNGLTFFKSGHLLATVC